MSSKSRRVSGKETLATAGTNVKFSAQDFLQTLYRCCDKLRLRSISQLSAQSQTTALVPKGEKTVIPDFAEPGGQDIQEEPANAFFRVKRHWLLPASMGIVAPEESYFSVHEIWRREREPAGKNPVWIRAIWSLVSDRHQ